MKKFKNYIKVLIVLLIAGVGTYISYTHDVFSFRSNGVGQAITSILGTVEKAQTEMNKILDKQVELNNKTLADAIASIEKATKKEEVNDIVSSTLKVFDTKNHQPLIDKLNEAKDKKLAELTKLEAEAKKKAEAEAKKKAEAEAKAKASQPKKTYTNTRKRDYCPRGDYTGSRYDGRCGSRPSGGTTSNTNTSSGGGSTNNTPAPKCTKPGYPTDMTCAAWDAQRAAAFKARCLAAKEQNIQNYTIKIQNETDPATKAFYQERLQVVKNKQC